MTNVNTASVAVGKAVLVAVGVPYGIAILLNSVSGWPQSDPAQTRFSKQLRPSRVLSLNYAICQQFSMVKWLPLLLRVRSFYGNADPTLQNIPFGENGMSMDIWIPQAKYDRQERSVVFFIYGGAWGSGYKELYAKFGQEVANNLGYVVVIPDYRIFPKGTMNDMVCDISDSIHEFRKLKSIRSEFSSNIDQIILIGHSAGAHLCAMAALNLVSKRQCLSTERSDKSSLSKLGHCRPTLAGNCILDDEDKLAATQKIYAGGSAVNPKDGFNHEQSEEAARNDYGKEMVEEKHRLVGNGDGKGRPTDDEESDVDSVPYVKGVIGIGGVYHVMDHYHHEAKRGVEDLSTMWRAAEGLINFGKYSPTLLVPSLTANQKQRLPPHMLIHGMNDTTVPNSSSSIYADVLSEAGVATALKILPEGGHADLVMDMMEPGRKWYSVMMSAIMEGTGSFLSD